MDRLARGVGVLGMSGSCSVGLHFGPCVVLS